MAPATFVYDDDCGFCTWWASRFARHTDLGVVGFSELTDAERARLPEGYEDCAHLLTGGAVYSCGEAIERALGRSNERLGALFAAARHLPGYAALRERAYRWAADRRSVWGRFVSRAPPARRG